MSISSNCTNMLEADGNLINLTVDSYNTLNMVKIKLDIMLTNKEYKNNLEI